MELADNNPMLRDGVTGDWIGTFFGHKGAVWSSRISTDASYAITGSADFTAKVWDPQTGECLHTLAHSHIVRAVAVPAIPNPTLVATGGAEKKLRIWDLARAPAKSSAASSNSSSTVVEAPTNGNPEHKPGNTQVPFTEIGPGVHGATIKSIVWGSDPNYLVTAADDNFIRWWDRRSPTPTAEYKVEGTLGSCELSTIDNHPSSRASPPPNSHEPILAVAAGKSAYFFKWSSPGQLIKEVKTSHNVASVAVNAVEKKFVVGGASDPWVRVYSFGSGLGDSNDDQESKELELQKGHHGPIWSTAFTNNGKCFATGSEDGTVKLWKFCREPYGLWKVGAGEGA
ncbi:hypothetical protein MMC25_001634 [Agyrium rufum]|nr:hypothetical protein [Agyrium rufum]